MLKWLMKCKVCLISFPIVHAHGQMVEQIFQQTYINVQTLSIMINSALEYVYSVRHLIWHLVKLNCLLICIRTVGLLVGRSQRLINKSTIDTINQKLIKYQVNENCFKNMVCCAYSNSWITIKRDSIHNAMTFYWLQWSQCLTYHQAAFVVMSVLSVIDY